VQGGRHGGGQVVEVGLAAHVVQPVLGAQLLGQGARIQGIAALVQAQDGLVNPTVAQDEEVLRREEGGDLVQRLRIHQDRAEDGLLGFDTVRREIQRVGIAPVAPARRGRVCPGCAGQILIAHKVSCLCWQLPQKT
jgi:hypothetical protein